uniref:Uncharacterized protein n=1 Tax=Arundo donax TaxID=35708 RepID=A0A0A8Z372_ARUDO
MLAHFSSKFATKAEKPRLQNNTIIQKARAINKICGTEREWGPRIRKQEEHRMN